MDETLNTPKSIQWSKMIIRPHFILWGRIATGSDDIAHLTITERGLDRKGYNGRDNTVWENTVSIKSLSPGHQACLIISKFERLWPCTFLAKEYRPDLHSYINYRSHPEGTLNECK